MKSILILMLFAAALAEAADEPLRFDGGGNVRTPEFERSGPWMLDWHTKSDNTLPKIFELRLYDAGAGDYVGTIVEVRDTGSSRRMFTETGRFRIEVVAQHLEWTLLISPVEEADRLQRRAEGRETLEDSTREYLRQVSEDSFESWRPVDDRTLLLFAKDETHGFRVTFAKPCRGLPEAKALNFMAAGYGSGGELYDAILLDDGTHCPFERVVPTVFD